jgi:hypothetical protein
VAHSCPDCGEACYCGGDIDDLFFEDSEEAIRCAHCPFEEAFQEDDWEDSE